MNLAALTPLVLFAIWAVLLGLAIVAVRTVYLQSGTLAWGNVPSGQPHGPERYWRLNRAHANTLENLPIFATVTLCGVWLQAAPDLVAALCWAVLGARVLQSTVHILSGGRAAVTVRAAFYVLQALGWLALGGLALRAALS